MSLLYHAYVYLEFLILACTIYILAPTLLTRKLRRTKEIVRTEQLIQLIAEQDGLREEFDEQLFKMTAEKIVVSKEHDITFCLHNGLKLTERGGGQDAVAHANRL